MNYGFNRKTKITISDIVLRTQGKRRSCGLARHYYVEYWVGNSDYRRFTKNEMEAGNRTSWDEICFFIGDDCSDVVVNVYRKYRIGKDELVGNFSSTIKEVVHKFEDGVLEETLQGRNAADSGIQLRFFFTAESCDGDEHDHAVKQTDVLGQFGSTPPYVEDGIVDECQAVDNAAKTIEPFGQFGFTPPDAGDVGQKTTEATELIDQMTPVAENDNTIKATDQIGPPPPVAGGSNENAEKTTESLDQIGTIPPYTGDVDENATKTTESPGSTPPATEDNNAIKATGQIGSTPQTTEDSNENDEKATESLDQVGSTPPAAEASNKNTAKATGSLDRTALLQSHVSARFASAPWLAPVVGLVSALITMFAQAHTNKNTLQQLQDRCIGFLVVIQQAGDSVSRPEQQILVTDAQSTLKNIINRMDEWCSKSALELFIKQADLTSALQDCHMEIDDSLAKLHLAAVSDTADWQSEFKTNNKRDQVEILQYLSDIKNTQSIIAMIQNQQSTDIKAIMALMQQNLSISPNRDNLGLGTNLYCIQKSTGKLLANMHLQRGEVRRLGQYPVSGTDLMDIWEGLYLNEEKVAIKILRAVNSTPETLQRFRREVDIWNRVWEYDQGRHILPLYGFCQNDGPFPYVVSPWHPNGTADKYVAHFPDVDHLALIRGISAGVRVLHTMDPPIVHGDLRAVNVTIDSAGNPLLANFGFSMVVEDTDTTGTPLDEFGSSNSQRWLAPELCFDKGRLTTAADVYALGMTMLELMTHAIPWATVKHTTQVIIKVASGEKPPRPRDDATVARGLDDHLWQVMQRCWDDAEIRPTASDIVEML